MSEKVKAAEATWITDRVPTRHDSDSNDDLWFSVDGRVMSRKFWYHENNDHDAWMPKPKTPEPFLPKVPIFEPDTSLAASCDRLEVWFNDEDVAEYLNGKVLTSEDAFRIIDAARKWDESQGRASTAATPEASNGKGSGVTEYMNGFCAAQQQEIQRLHRLIVELTKELSKAELSAPIAWRSQIPGIPLEGKTYSTEDPVA